MSVYHPERSQNRVSVRIPLGPDPNCSQLLIPIQGLGQKRLAEDHEVDELVRASLEKKGFNKLQIEAMMEKAERNVEYYFKVQAARREIKRLMAERAKGNKLMQVGFRKWKPAFYRPIVIPGGR